MWICVHVHHGGSQFIEVVPVWHVFPATIAANPVKALPTVQEVQEALITPHNSEMVGGQIPNKRMEDFMKDASMANVTPLYRIKFVSYLHSDIPNAAYLEGMRLATIENNVDEALKVMKPMSSKSPLASLAIPLLMICRGQHDHGRDRNFLAAHWWFQDSGVNGVQNHKTCNSVQPI